MFEEFCQAFELRYDIQYSDSPKVTMDTAIQRWKAEHTTTESIDPRLSLAQYDNIRDM